MKNTYPTLLVLPARLLLALMFILAGFGKLSDISGTAGYIASAGLPLPAVLAVLTGLLELIGGLFVVIGFQARWTGLALAVFTLTASYLFHAFWAAPTDQQYVAQLLFMKNISVAGGLLLLSALGAGPLSLDARLRQQGR